MIFAKIPRMAMGPTPTLSYSSVGLWHYYKPCLLVRQWVSLTKFLMIITLLETDGSNSRPCPPLISPHGGTHVGPSYQGWAVISHINRGRA